MLRASPTFRINSLKSLSFLVDYLLCAAFCRAIFLLFTRQNIGQVCSRMRRRFIAWIFLPRRDIKNALLLFMRNLLRVQFFVVVILLTLAIRQNIVMAQSLGCLSLTTTTDEPYFDAGKEIGYYITFRNECESLFYDADLTVILPREVNFSATNYGEYMRDANALAYRLGDISRRFQSSVMIRVEVEKNVLAEQLWMTATLRARDANGKSIVVQAVHDISLEHEEKVFVVVERFAASVVVAVGGIMQSIWFWITLAPIMIFSAGYFVFGRNGNGHKTKTENVSVAQETSVLYAPPAPHTQLTSILSSPSYYNLREIFFSEEENSSQPFDGDYTPEQTFDKQT